MVLDYESPLSRISIPVTSSMARGTNKLNPSDYRLPQLTPATYQGTQRGQVAAGACPGPACGFLQVTAALNRPHLNSRMHGYAASDHEHHPGRVPVTQQ